MHLKTILRPLIRYRYFTLINTLGLSLGIVCSIVIFIYTISHLDTDAFHNDAERIYRLVLDIKTPGGLMEHEPGSSLPMRKAIESEFAQVEESAFCMRFYSSPTLTVHGKGREDRYREEGTVAYADQNFLEMFSHEFLAGNKSIALTEPRKAVLSRKLAVKYFGSVEAALGQLITVNNLADVYVTGVFVTKNQHSDLHFGMLISLPTIKILQPYYQEENFAWVGSNNWTFLKLRKNVSPEDVEGQLSVFSNKYFGPDLSHWSMRMQPLSDMHFDVRYDGAIRKSILWILLGIAAMLLLVVSVNYINLTIAQAHYRAKEIGIRKYLGAGRRQLFVQFMSETCLLVFVSLVFAAVTVKLILPVLNQWLELSLGLDPFINMWYLGFTLLFMVTLILLAGYYPAIHLSGFNPQKAISGNITGGSKQVFGKFLLTFQYTIALFFLIGTTVIVKQVNFLFNNDLGFDKEHVINVRLPKSDYHRMQTFRDEVANLPGVEAASLHNQPPMSASNDGGFIRFDNRQQMEDYIVRERWADEYFLEAYSMRLISGRNIHLKSDSLPEVVVNESLVHKLGIANTEDVLGKTIVIDNSSTHGTIVGVVHDFHHRSLQSEIEPLVINPMTSVFNHIGIRIHPRRLDQVTTDIKNTYMKHFPNGLFEFTFLEHTIQRMYKVENTISKLMKLFSFVAVAISIISIMALSTFSNMKRAREMAIRKVMGATIRDVIAILCRQYMILFLIGFLIAVPVSYLLADKWLSEFAYHIVLDPTVLLIPGALLVVTSIVFICLQSLKTAVVNVVEAMKHE